MHFHKQDLEGTNYHWLNDEVHVFSGQPTRRSFDKLNGNQILFIINHYASNTDKFTIPQGKIIEKKILEDLPEQIKSEISVFNWIKDIIFFVE